MKEYNEIDKLFEEQLGDLRVEPSEQAWANIASGLDAAGPATARSTKHKKRMWLWFGLGAAAAILAYIFFINKSDAQIQPKENIPVVHQEQPQQEAAPATAPSVKSAETPSSSGSRIADAPQEQVETEEHAAQEAGVQAQTESQIQAQTENALAGTKQADNPKPAIQSQTDKKEPVVIPAPAAVVAGENKAAKDVAVPQNIESANQSVESAEQAGAENMPEVNSVEESKVNPAEEQQPETTAMRTEQPAAGNNEENNAVNREETAIAAKEEPQVVAQEESAVVSQEETNAESEEVVTLNETEETEIIPTENNDTNADIASESSLPEPGELAGTHYATGWSVDLLGGPAWIFSNEKTEYQEGAPIMTPGPPASITVPSIELNVKFHINNWFIQSGLAYAEYGENRTFSQKLEMHDTSGYSKMEVKEYYTYDSTGIFVDPSGVIVIMYDAVQHSDTSYKWITEDSLYYEHLAIQAENRYRYIEIPLMLGYEFRFKNLGLQLSTGVSFGFRVNSTGKFLDAQNNLVDITPDNSPYTNQMMNYILTVGVNYHLNRRLSVSVQPTYKTNINTLFAGDNSTRYNHYGVNMGINYIIK